MEVEAEEVVVEREEFVNKMAEEEAVEEAVASGDLAEKEGMEQELQLAFIYIIIKETEILLTVL